MKEYLSRDRHEQEQPIFTTNKPSPIYNQPSCSNLTQENVTLVIFNREYHQSVTNPKWLRD